MAVKQEWSTKYRAAILEKDSACRLLRVTEADDAIQRRMEEVEEMNGKHQRSSTSEDIPQV